MVHLKKILDKFNGVSFPQEYLCLDASSFDQSPRLLLYIDGRYRKDVTHEHVFSGYSPLLFSFGSNNRDPSDFPEKIQLRLVSDNTNINEAGREKDALAVLEMKKIGTQSVPGITLTHFEATKGRHHFLNSFQQYLMAVSNSWFNRKKDNVFLHKDLYRQVQIAYAVPRTIALVTVGHKGHYNLFPTDLHGPLDENFYLDSLRQKGLALQQVREAGRILISEVDASFYKEAYRLGKNHMQALRPRNELPFSAQDSPFYQLPIPNSAILIRELELVSEFPHGIHQLLLFRVSNTLQIAPTKHRLAHIHSVYASWRKKQGLGGNYLLR
jgi:hypothetical protein